VLALVAVGVLVLALVAVGVLVLALVAVGVLYGISVLVSVAVSVATSCGFTLREAACVYCPAVYASTTTSKRIRK
jgi:hypothetical protein